MAHFCCPACGGKRVWKPEIAGKRAKCACGQVITIPPEPPGAVAAARPPATFEEAFEAAADSYDVRDEPMAIAATHVPPAIIIEREQEDGTVSTIHRPRVKSDTAALPRRKGLRAEPAKEPAPPSMLRDWVLPAILIAAGIPLCFVDGRYQGEGTWKPLDLVAAPVTISMVVSLVFAIGGVFGASALGGVAFDESVPKVIFKLCAVALLPAAIGGLTNNYVGGINGNIASVFASLACYFGLFLLLFRLPLSDQFVCVVLLFIIRTAVAYMAFRLEGAKAGSSI